MDGEDEADEEAGTMGDWWRLESLKGSESPSKTHNQWDLSGLMLYSDDDCKDELARSRLSSRARARRTRGKSARRRAGATWPVSRVRSSTNP